MHSHFEPVEPRLLMAVTATFLASSGLAVLIQAAHRVDARDARLRLVVTTRAVRRPLEVTGTDQLFDMHSDVPSATGGGCCAAARGPPVAPTRCRPEAQSPRSLSPGWSSSVPVSSSRRRSSRSRSRALPASAIAAS